MNDWLKILEAFRDGKFPKYYYGLTLRFIIGGCQIPIGKKFETSEFAYEATKQMFDEMQAFNENGKVVISNNCGIHHGKVMSLSETKWTENTMAASFEEIWNRYGEEIIIGTYHIDSEERAILEQIFK